MSIYRAINEYACTYTYTRIYTCIYVYIHNTNIRTYTYTCTSPERKLLGRGEHDTKLKLKKIIASLLARPKWPIPRHTLSSQWRSGRRPLHWGLLHRWEAAGLTGPPLAPQPKILMHICVAIELESKSQFTGPLPCTYNYACAYAHVHTCTCMHICNGYMYICICMYSCMRICVRTYIRSRYIRTYVHIRAHAAQIVN